MSKSKSFEYVAFPKAIRVSRCGRGFAFGLGYDYKRQEVHFDVGSAGNGFYYIGDSWHMTPSEWQKECVYWIAKGGHMGRRED